MGIEEKSQIELATNGEILLYLMSLDEDSLLEISKKFPCIKEAISLLIAIS